MMPGSGFVQMRSYFLEAILNDRRATKKRWALHLSKHTDSWSEDPKPKRKAIHFLTGFPIVRS